MRHAGDRCPVCGYGALLEPPYDRHGSASFEICPCCGTEFGSDDFETGHDVLRQRWIERGMRWWSLHSPPPSGWDPAGQLRKAGFGT